MSALVFRASDGVVIRGRPSDEQLVGAAPITGLYFEDEGFDGWDNAPEARRSAAPRPGAVGEFDPRVYAGSRAVTCTGHALAESEDELAVLGDLVRGSGVDGNRVRLTVDHQGRTLWADARRIVANFDDKGVRDGDLIRASFELQYVCARPWRYGETVPFPLAPSAVVFHRGNAPAHPVIERPNGAASYTITAPDKGTLTVAGAPVGERHVIDLRTGRFTSNGVRLWGKLTGPKWSVLRGERVTVALSSGSGVLSLTDTYS